MDKITVDNSEEIPSTTVLLDHRVLGLATLWSRPGDDVHAVQRQLKLASFAWSKFVLLRSGVKRLHEIHDGFEKTILGPAFIGETGVHVSEAGAQNIRQLMGWRLDTLLSLSAFEVVDDHTISASGVDAPTRQQDGVLSGNPDVTPPMQHRGTNEQTQLTVVAGHQLGLPVLTLDGFLASCFDKPALELCVSSPVSSELVDSLDLDEILDLAAPFRRAYGTAFARIMTLASKVLQLEDDNERLTAISEDRSMLIHDLDEQLTESRKSLGRLRGEATPKIGETLLWTAAEIAVGFLPIPVPLSPVAHLVRWRSVDQADRTP